MYTWHCLCFCAHSWPYSPTCTSYHIAENFWGRRIGEKYDFYGENFSQIASFCHAKGRHTPKFCRENFHEWPQNLWKFSPSKVSRYMVFPLSPSPPLLIVPPPPPPLPPSFRPHSGSHISRHLPLILQADRAAEPAGPAVQHSHASWHGGPGDPQRSHYDESPQELQSHLRVTYTTQVWWRICED